MSSLALAGRFPWPGVLLVLVLAALTRSQAIIVLAACGLAAWAIVEATGRLALTSLEVACVVEPDRVVAGETATAVVTITNRKPLPMPWLEVRLELPEGVEPDDAPPGRPRNLVSVGFAPRPHERVRLRFALRAATRGAHAIGPLRLRAGDWLGFLHDEREVATGIVLTAYPAPLSVADRHVAALRPLSETAAKRGLVPDPLRFRGVRPHRSGDPRKEIHWKMSARLRELQTKLYEPAASLDVVFLVNVASYDQFWIQADPEATETVVRAAATLVRLAADAGRQVGLVTNGIDGVTHVRPRSALGRGPRPLRRSLEILARLGPYAADAPETVFLRERGRLAWGCTLVLVSPRLPVGLANALVALRRAHHRVLALVLTTPPEGALSRLAAADVHVSHLGGEAARASA